MQCLHIWFTIWFFAISVNNSVASPVDILSVDNKNELGDLNTAESKPDEAEVSERDNEVGYLRKEDEKGADAYQHFESFHDKDGDAYGYEKHEAYGKSNKGESLNDEKDNNAGSHYNYVQELGDKPKYQKYQGSNDDPGKQSNYHYSYNSDDDEEEKPNYSSSYREDIKKDEDEKPNHYSSSYREDIKKDDSSEKDDEEEDDSDNETDKDEEKDEEKSTNFSYRIISDDYEDDGNGDVNSKGNGNEKGYNFGHGDRNTVVNYITKKSDYTAGDDDADGDEDDDEEEGEEENDEDNNVNHKDQKNDQKPKDKDVKSYSTYTTFSSQEGDDENDDEKKDDKEVPKTAIRHQKSHPKNDYRKVEESDESEENDGTFENDEKPQQVIHKEDIHHEDVELHQPAAPAKPRPTKPVTLVKEHRSGYQVQGNLPKSVQSQVVIHPSKPIVHVEEHKSGYKIEESGGDHQGSDESGKGNAGTVSKHLYEIYVTHDTGKANGGGGGGEGGEKGSDDAGDGGAGKSENLVVEPVSKPKVKSNENDNGAYKVKINYGKNPKSKGKKSKGKRKGSLKKKKQIIKPHKYEVEEYIDNEEETKKPIIAGKESSPQHHRDSEDYSNGQQQFIYASEADSDAYYW